MKTLKTILFATVLFIGFTSCTTESLDEDETLLNDTEILSQGRGDTGGVIDTDGGQGGD